jgi:tetratricopeptide (TPR) repeat protein
MPVNISTSAQVANASGPCSVVINANHAVVTANLNCDVEVAKALQRLLDDAANVQRDRESLIQHIKALNASVQTVFSAARLPQATTQAKQAADNLLKGDVAGAAQWLGVAAETSSHRAAELLRQQAALLRLKDARAALAVLKRALEIEPNDFETLRHAGDLAKVAGNVSEAREHYTRMSWVAERKRGAAHGSMGSAWQTLGDWPAAGAEYQAALAVHQKLAAIDPTDSQWQCDLAVSHERLGDWQTVQGDLSAALKHYQIGLEIRQRHVQTHPDDLEWQSGLATSHQKIGEVRQGQGNSTAAMQSQKAAQALRQKLPDALSSTLPDVFRPVQAVRNGSTACS